MKRKKSIIFVLALILLIAFVGCKDKFDAESAKKSFKTTFANKIAEIKVGEEVVATASFKSGDDIEVEFQLAHKGKVALGARQIVPILDSLVGDNSKIYIADEDLKNGKQFTLKDVDTEALAKHILSLKNMDKLLDFDGEVKVKYDADIHVSGGLFKMNGWLVFQPPK